MTTSYKNCEYELKCNEPFMTLQNVALHSLLLSQKGPLIRAKRPMVTKSSFFQTKFVSPSLDLNPTNKKRALYYFASQRSMCWTMGSQPNPKRHILEGAGQTTLLLNLHAQLHSGLIRGGGKYAKYFYNI